MECPHIFLRFVRGTQSVFGAGVGTHDMRTLFTDETLVAHPLASFVHNPLDETDPADEHHGMTST
jgi:hypothetical protein